MTDRIVNVTAIQPYRLEVWFAGGFSARVDVASELYGEIFEPLREPAMFMQARFDPELGTVVWPNEADLSPEFLADAGLTASS